MKKSELRKIIRESIKELMNEEIATWYNGLCYCETSHGYSLIIPDCDEGSCAACCHLEEQYPESNKSIDISKTGNIKIPTRPPVGGPRAKTSGPMIPMSDPDIGDAGFQPYGGSDIRLKENITKTGVSKSGIPTYTFNYKNDNTLWSGTMAQDLLEMGMEDAVKTMDNGYYAVNYNMIDVDMTKI